VGPLAPLGVPVRKPLLNLRETSFNERMRPVPVVFLLLAFSPQLSVVLHVRCVFSYVKGGCVVVVRERCVDGLLNVGWLFVGHNGCVRGVLIGGRGIGIGSEERTLSDASAGVAAVGASVLLDVERARTCVWPSVSISGSGRTRRLIESGRRRRWVVGSCIPQRLHRTCVLLWRLPKDPVPLAARGC
jgi:hypothetical protein